MIIDITELDKIQVLQALYINGNPKGYGKATYAIKGVEGLSIQEAADILKKGAEKRNSTRRSGHTIDYVNGVPIKWDGIEKNGRYLLYINGYDFRHGNFKALDAIYNTFLVDEFSIVRKGYGDVMVSGNKPESKERFSIERDIKYKALLKQSEKINHSYGIRYHLHKLKKV